MRKFIFAAQLAKYTIRYHTKTLKERRDMIYDALELAASLKQ